MPSPTDPEKHLLTEMFGSMFTLWLDGLGLSWGQGCDIAEAISSKLIHLAEEREPTTDEKLQFAANNYEA